MEQTINNQWRICDCFLDVGQCLCALTINDKEDEFKNNYPVIGVEDNQFDSTKTSILTNSK